MAGITDKPQNFHVPLPQQLYQELRAFSKQEGKPATVIARTAIEKYLKEQREAWLDREILEYARTEAGTEADLLEEFEAAALEAR